MMVKEVLHRNQTTRNDTEKSVLRGRHGFLSKSGNRKDVAFFKCVLLNSNRNRLSLSQVFLFVQSDRLLFLLCMVKFHA